MSLDKYFSKKPKTSSKKGGVGSKRKLSNDADESQDPEASAPDAKRQKLSSSSETKTNNSSSSSSSSSDTKNEEKTAPEDGADKYVSDDGEEEDFDVAAGGSKSNSKSKTKSKSDAVGDEKEESADATDAAAEAGDAPDWEATKAKIDVSKLKYAESDILLHPSWKKQLKNELNKPYFAGLRRKLTQEESSGAEIFPPVGCVFRAFELCPWDDLKVVLLGQDPYHDNGQAEGLCFSVPRGIKVPSSLKNMYKEALSDIGMKSPSHGSLVQWGKQGVLLLNTVLTVRAHKANSHAKYGWQDFTDAVIKKISNSHDGVVFILWGKQAQKKKKLIDLKKHRVVESAHPSGLSASRGFYGSKPYSKTNDLLKELGREQIDWTIDPQ